MKQLRLNTTAVSILSVVMLLTSCGDRSQTSESQTGQTKTKLDSTAVPKVVTESFYKAFPSTTYVDWYGYPSFNQDSDWYQYEPTYFSNQPADKYYIAEFTHRDTINRVVYDKNGQNIAIHQKLSGALPAPVADSIKDGNYRSWTVAQDKEQIFKDAGIDQIKVYRVVMEKGDKKHTLYFQQNGKMLRDVKVS